MFITDCLDLVDDICDRYGIGISPERAGASVNRIAEAPVPAVRYGILISIGPWRIVMTRK